MTPPVSRAVLCRLGSARDVGDDNEAGVTQSRTEVVAERVVPSRHRVRASQAVAATLALAEEEAQAEVSPAGR